MPPIDLLKPGRVAEWNSWRSENPKVQLDLSNARFTEVDLTGVNLSRCILNGADFTRAKLNRANLADCHLRQASFVGADLSNSDISDSDLTGANLSLCTLSSVFAEGCIFADAALDRTSLVKAELSIADFTRAILHSASLSDAICFQSKFIKADLTAAHITDANFFGADLSGAILANSDLQGSIFSQAKLSGADLRKANLTDAQFSRADLSGCDLCGAIAIGAVLVRTCLRDANLTGSRVYGASVWDADLGGATQSDLIITPWGEPDITVDHLEVAQFIYLLLNNAKLRDVIDTVTAKAVLILGRFKPERKRTLDALRNALRARNYLPIVFDFEKPTNRDFTETVSTLAHLARFLIADLTDPRSIPQELTAIVPRLLSVPVRPLLLGDHTAWGMFDDLRRYPQVIAPLHYTDDEMLLGCLESEVIAPAEKKVVEMRGEPVAKA